MRGLRGGTAMANKLRDIAKRFPDRVASAIYMEANSIMSKSKRLCPVAPDGGTLRASGTVHKPERKGRQISVLMSYGGAAQDYAIAVHEHLSEHSPPSWIIAEETGRGINWNADGTGPKFLEIPINEAMPGMLQRLAARIHLDKAKNV